MVGAVGANRRIVQEKCAVCEKTFEEDELELAPYEKTGRVELMCGQCKKTNKAPTLDDVRIKTTKKEEYKVKTEKKPDNKKKELVNEDIPLLKETSVCACAKLPMCKAIRATQAWDEFSNKEIKAFFIGAGFDFYKIDFCPFCGKELYKK